MCIRDSYNTRGRGEHVRLLFEYTGVPYTEKRYTDGAEWFGKDKLVLKAILPNLPYLTLPSGESITESDAIIQWIINTAGKPELEGKTINDKVLVTGYRDILNGFQMSIVYGSFVEDPNVAKENIVKVVNEQGSKLLTSFNKILEGKTFLSGDYVVWADFHLYAVLELISTIKPDALTNYPNIVKFHQSVRNLPAINAYINSPRYVKGPFYNAVIQK
eukprot:TRINITY_DN2958_c0_g1_i1.p1 TRINITY_DN2958_c0_g1~~TRINITY_DN2958_c0_g1_i1.p1  ORF type:complete len:217 (+),score=98.77 TRINITY_DN2958_c0_g1_i1:66-716(+)